MLVDSGDGRYPFALGTAPAIAVVVVFQLYAADAASAFLFAVCSPFRVCSIGVLG